MGQGQSSGNSGTPQETPLAKTDYYELLGVERTATEDEIKKAYRRKALELHPDRNYGNVENATRLFAEVQSAYEVLSDPQERVWYDSHRDVLLRVDDAAVAEGEEYSYNVRMTTADEVLKFMLRFSGRLEFSDKSSGFYGGLRDFLGRIAKEEQIACQWEGLHEVDYPEFGHRDDDYEDVVRPFYAAWNGFATKKSYSWKDRYRLSDAPDRRIRRLMERENKNLREEAIREYNDAVRSLIAFVRKRDPRYQENQKSEGERQKILRDAAAAQAARSRAARQARMEELDQAILPEWATSSAVNEHEGGFESEEEQEQHEFECVVCQKSFKSEAQYRAHEKSKKHINLLKQLKKEMREEGHDLDLEGANRDDEQDGHCEEHVDPPSELVTAAVNDVGEDYNSGEKIPVAGEMIYHEADDESDDNLKENGVDASNVLNPPTEKSHGSYSPALPESDSASDSDPDYAPRSEIIDRLKAATLTPASETGEGTEGSNSDLPSQPKIGKAKLKRQKRAAATAAQKTTGDGGGGKREAEFKCAVCQAAFPSKTKLFSHVKDRGHAAPVSQVNNRGKGGKGRVK